MSVAASLPGRCLRSFTMLVVLGVAGCASLPRSGPSTAEVIDRFKDGSTADGGNPLGVRLVDLSPKLMPVLGEPRPSSFTQLEPVRAGAQVDRIGPGDILAISIYEAGPGLFTSARPPGSTDSATSGAENLPRVQVDRAGRITVPFAGQVSVAGRTATEVESIIQNRLAAKAAEPQVIVTVVSGDTNTVMVSGDVKNPGRRQLTLAGRNTARHGRPFGRAESRTG